MCQILGISYKMPAAWNKAWDKFRERAAQNRDGWGIAYGDINGLAVMKQPERADRSALAAALGKTELPAPMMIGHVRLASRGSIAITNTHPFFANVNGRDWAMVHNGSLVRYGLTPGQYGQTDSESFFLRMVKDLEAIYTNSPYDVAELIAGLARSAGKHGKLNIIIIGGEHMYVHTNVVGSLFQLQTRAGVMFCSQPLTRQRGWKPVELNRVYVFRAGEFFYRTDMRKHVPLMARQVSIFA
ncbi:MAG: glucosamine--fructose-6-phosphate aminotransferase [Pelotomaculum sp. PtaU1.Bin065]|nr:MAG: glucosamine--fructose-6-phosphate aminotransferase [Pelotomaculum sp. PtaU1.Bin065]